MRRLLVDVLEEATTRGMPIGVGDRIKQARVEAGLTQDELAELVGVGMRQIQYYEADESDPYRKLGRIAEVTGKPLAWLLRGDEDATPQQPDMQELAQQLEEMGARLERIERLLRGEGSQGSAP